MSDDPTLSFNQATIENLPSQEAFALSQLKSRYPSIWDNIQSYCGQELCCKYLFNLICPQDEYSDWCPPHAVLDALSNLYYLHCKLFPVKEKSTVGNFLVSWDN